MLTDPNEAKGQYVLGRGLRPSIGSLCNFPGSAVAIYLSAAGTLERSAKILNPVPTRSTARPGTRQFFSERLREMGPYSERFRSDIGMPAIFLDMAMLVLGCLVLVLAGIVWWFAVAR